MFIQMDRLLNDVKGGKLTEVTVMITPFVDMVVGVGQYVVRVLITWVTTDVAYCAALALVEVVTLAPTMVPAIVVAADTVAARAMGAAMIEKRILDD